MDFTIGSCIRDILLHMSYANAHNVAGPRFKSPNLRYLKLVVSVCLKLKVLVGKLREGLFAALVL